MDDGYSLEDRLYKLYQRAKSNTEWLQDALIDFIIFQKGRVSKGEIKDSTVPNYYKPVKLFCDMNDIIINWNLDINPSDFCLIIKHNHHFKNCIKV